MVDYNNSEAAEQLLTKLRAATRDYLYAEPDDYGQRHTPVDDVILGSFYDYKNWDSDKERYPKVKVSEYGLYELAYTIVNYDLICIKNDGSIDFNNSNHPDVAKLVQELIPQDIMAQVYRNLIGENKAIPADINHIINLAEGLTRSMLKEYSHDVWHCDMHDWPLVNSYEGGGYGKLWKVGIWCGSGYVLNVYRAWGTCEEDALEQVVAWLEDNQPSLLKDDVVERWREELQAEGKGEEEIWDEIDQTFMYVDPGHYIYYENLTISEFPAEYVEEYGKEDGENMTEGVDMGQVKSCQDKKDAAAHRAKRDEKNRDIHRQIAKLRRKLVDADDAGDEKEVKKLQKEIDTLKKTLAEGVDSVESFYQEEDYDGKTGQPGMVRSYDIGWNNSIDSFKHSAEEEGVSLEEFLKTWWNETSNETPWAWQKLGSGYGFHGDTILKLGNVVFKEIHGQLMIDEHAPQGMHEDFNHGKLEKDTLHFTLDDPQDVDSVLTKIEDMLADTSSANILSIETVVPGKEYCIPGIESDYVWEEIAQMLDGFDEVDVLTHDNMQESKQHLTEALQSSIIRSFIDKYGVANPGAISEVTDDMIVNHNISNVYPSQEARQKDCMVLKGKDENIWLILYLKDGINIETRPMWGGGSAWFKKGKAGDRDYHTAITGDNDATDNKYHYQNHSASNLANPYNRGFDSDSYKGIMDSDPTLRSAYMKRKKPMLHRNESIQRSIDAALKESIGTVEPKYAGGEKEGTDAEKKAFVRGALEKYGNVEPSNMESLVDYIFNMAKSKGADVTKESVARIFNEELKKVCKK